MQRKDRVEMKQALKVVILCGGKGTRIRDVSNDIPKPMILIGGVPILWHIMKYYSYWGHKQFILCLGYKGQIIKEFFLNYRVYIRDFTIHLGNSKVLTYHNKHEESDWKITLADTGLESMTGARIQRIRKFLLRDDNFLLTYGDGLSDIDLDQLIQFHFSHKKILTVSGVRPPGRFGELRCDSSGMVKEFNEKPQASGGRISGGFFVCRKELFDYLDDREDLVFEEEPMRQMVHDKQIMAFKHDGFWQPMDTHRDYLLLNGLFEKGKAPWVLT